MLYHVVNEYSRDGTSCIISSLIKFISLHEWIFMNLHILYLLTCDLYLFSSLRDVSLDTGMPSRSNYQNPASGLELCDCPRSYNSSSCQDPSLGFFRQKSSVVSSTIIIQLVGEAAPCECNGRSSVCDIETGRCQVGLIVNIMKCWNVA